MPRASTCVYSALHVSKCLLYSTLHVSTLHVSTLHVSTLHSSTLHVSTLHVSSLHVSRFGRVEWRARLPLADWIRPALWLMPERDTYGGAV